jgi:MFS family permease
MGTLTRRFSERTLIVGGLGLLCLSLLAWGFTSRLWLLLVVLAPTALAAGVLNVALTSALTKASSREDVGGTLGIAASLQSLTGVIAPILGGFLLERAGAWSLGVLAAVILAWLTTFAIRRVRTAAAGSGLREATT